MSERTYEDELRGVLFPSNRKREGSKDPDYEGNVVVNGAKYSMAGWKNKSKAGRPYLAVRLRPWYGDERPERPPGRKPEPPVGSEQEDFDDDIPF